MRKERTDAIDSSIMGFTEYCIKWIIRFLAVVVVIVIMFSAVDIIMLILSRMMRSSNYLISLEHIVDILGGFLTVLIAIEIYQNIVLYLKEDVIQVKAVLATAVIAVSRKVIIMDFSTSQPLSVIALSGIVLSVAVAYWLVRGDRRLIKTNSPKENEGDK
ncbi:MAG: phosphate-starvation-inducible PsiE family protein [Candidatus Hydrogenedentes bacterium]|nr:phosphate-starvation-inducible PsiE family protein [Candidatus Hydrogenedentota bacterium]